MNTNEVNKIKSLNSRAVNEQRTDKNIVEGDERRGEHPSKIPTNGSTPIVRLRKDLVLLNQFIDSDGKKLSDLDLNRTFFYDAYVSRFVSNGYDDLYSINGYEASIIIEKNFFRPNNQTIKSRFYDGEVLNISGVMDWADAGFIVMVHGIHFQNDFFDDNLLRNKPFIIVEYFDYFEGTESHHSVFLLPEIKLKTKWFI